MAECDLEHTFVTSDHHFRDWMHLGGALAESTQEEEAEHIALWNSVVGKDDLNLRLIHIKEEAKALHSGERILYGHEHRLMSGPPPTTCDSICVCAKWHGWKPITLAEAIRQMDSAQG